MKCTQCGNEFEGNFCPVCGTKAQPAVSAGAGQSAAQPPQNAGQSAQGAPPQNSAPAADGAEQSAAQEQRLTAPEPVQKPKPSGLVLPISTIILNSVWTSLYGVLSILNILLCGGSWRFLPTDGIIIGVVLLACAALIIGIAAIMQYNFKWGVNLSNRYRRRFMRKKRPSEIVSKWSCDPKKQFWFQEICMWAFGLLSISVVLLDWFLLGRGSTATIFIEVIYFLLSIGLLCAFFLWQKKYGRTVNLAYYGKEKPNKNDKPIVTYGQVEAALRQYEAEWENYLLYKPKKRSFERGAVFTSGNASTLLWLRVKGLRILAALIAAVLIVCISVFSVQAVTNIFRPQWASRAEVGMSTGEIDTLFGDPYEHDTETNTYRYYSEPYRGLLEESENFDPDDIQDLNDFGNALLEAAQLAERMRTTQYSYIEVVFEQSAVVSFLFDPSRTEERTGISGSGAERTVLSAEIEQGAETGTAVVTTEYEDGSLWKARVEGSLTEGATETAGSTVTLRCFDPYAQEYFTVQATVTEIPEYTW